MPGFAEGAPFGSIDFSEEDTWMTLMDVDEITPVVEAIPPYGDGLGWDERQTGMRSSASRPDQVIGLDGNYHTDATRALWLVDGTTLGQS